MYKKGAFLLLISSSALLSAYCYFTHGPYLLKLISGMALVSFSVAALAFANLTPQGVRGDISLSRKALRREMQEMEEEISMAKEASPGEGAKEKAMSKRIAGNGHGR